MADEPTIAGVAAELAQTQSDGDMLWNILAAILVYGMQLGFALLEMGYLHPRHYGAVLNKNVTDLGLAAVSWWIIGWGLTGFGSEGDNKWIVTTLQNPNPEASNYSFWFFQLSFAATAATIISGAIAGRTKMVAYCIISALTTGIIYPIVVHWAWDGEGFLYEIGYLDFAGSGVVHMLGGTLALIGAIAVGPRGEWAYKTNPATRVYLVSTGSLILFLGWFGFNAGSTGAMYESMATASQCVLTTILGAAAGFLTQSVINSIKTKSFFDSSHVEESVSGGLLAGLVSVTAGTDRLAPEWAVIAGSIGAILSYFTNYGLKKAGVDDPVGAIGVHGAAGAWGVLILAVAPGYSDNTYDWTFHFKSQFIGVFMILVWSAITGSIVFATLKYTIGLRDEALYSPPSKKMAQHPAYNVEDGIPETFRGKELNDQLSRPKLMTKGDDEEIMCVDKS